VPERKSSGPSELRGNSTDLRGTPSRFLKNTAFAPFDLGTSTTATPCVRLGRRWRGGVAGCTVQSAKTDVVNPLRRRRFRAVSVSTGT
jgi:hypothetical protein